jgi:hypothetical protein
MTRDEWREASDDILWKSMFVRDLTDTVVDHGARDLIASPYADKSAGFYYDGIKAALRSDEVLTAAHRTPHAEPVFRDFLRRIRDRMDELRPWPTPPYVRLPLDDWPRFADARAVATVPVRMGDAEQKLLVSAHRLPGGGEASVLMLRLGTGEEVALVGNPGIKPMTLLLRGPGGSAVEGSGVDESGADRACAGERAADRADVGEGAADDRGLGSTGSAADRVGAGGSAADGPAAGGSAANREGSGRNAADGPGAGGNAADRVGAGGSAADGPGAGGSAVEAFTAATGLPASPVAAPPPWQGLINGILYTLIFSHALDGAEVDRVAALIVEQRSLPGGPARHRAAIRQALAAPDILDDSLPTQFSEPDFREFLTRLVRKLDERER